MGKTQNNMMWEGVGHSSALAQSYEAIHPQGELRNDQGSLPRGDVAYTLSLEQWEDQVRKGILEKENTLYKNIFYKSVEK